MDPAIFRAYDVRGLYPDEIDAAAARAIGSAVARFLGASPVVVGRDMRESGEVLREALLDGLCGEGVDVIDVGRVSTPALYYGTSALGAAGGVMITASHNPARYNGLKLCREAARPIGIETGLREIQRLAEAGGPGAAERRGRVEARPILDAYHEDLLELFPARPRLRAVIDAGNGIAGEAVAGLLDRLPLEVTRLYFEPDGSFPNHEADPLKLENVADLRREVLARGADLGAAFDGDGDRVVFIDERGEPLPADLTTALFARAVLERGLLGAAEGVPVVYDLRSSRVVPEEIHRRGGVPVRSRVGHAFIKQRMRETGACFGGELSGHYYFRFPAGYVADDGAAGFLLMLEVLADARRPLSELWQPLRRYAQSGEVNRRVADPAAVMRRVREAFPDGEADELDGLTVQYPEWWFNLRPSNTESLLRLNVEADSPEAMAGRRDRIVALMES
jgi:phosphomannomutase